MKLQEMNGSFSILTCMNQRKIFSNFPAKTKKRFLKEVRNNIYLYFCRFKNKQLKINTMAKSHDARKPTKKEPLKQQKKKAKKRKEKQSKEIKKKYRTGTFYDF